MIEPCGHCGGQIDMSYRSYQRSPDYPNEVFCWTLKGGRDNCLEAHREAERDKEEETCLETEHHTEISGEDYCDRCGQRITTDWEGGI